MTGCRYGAKNTLVKNYLGLAERAGAEVLPMTTVTGFQQRSDGLWEVRTARTGLGLPKRRKFTATHVVLAAGTFGTQKLLFKMRDKGKLPKLSDKLGVLTRTNSESIVGAATLTVPSDLDLTHGVAITSSIHPTSDTHVEPVRYGKGSNAMGLLQTLMTDGTGPGGTDVPRWKQLLDSARHDPRGIMRMLNPRHWSERTVIALVMQHLDNSITTFTKRGKLGFRHYSSKQGHGEPNPTWIPVGNEVTRRIAIEEVFSLCEDEFERETFIRALLAAARGRTRVVIGLRADFYAHCARVPELVAALPDAQLIVGPMTPEELSVAITEPAARAGLMVEKTLVATIVAEAASRPAALPFVSHALWETWRRRRGTGLFLAGYQAAGGLDGAVAQSADRVFGELDEEHRRAARRILVRLTALGDGTEDTRRRVARTELGDDAVTAHVLERLAATRLVTIGADTVEIAHEALIRGWPALRDWLAADRESLRAHRRLTGAATDWATHGHDDAFLYRGSLLVGWTDRDTEALNETERGFLAASLARESRDHTRRRRRLRTTIGGLVTGLITVSLLAALAVAQTVTANAQRDLAVASGLAAQSRDPGDPAGTRESVGVGRTRPFRDGSDRGQRAGGAVGPDARRATIDRACRCRDRRRVQPGRPHRRHGRRRRHRTPVERHHRRPDRVLPAGRPRERARLRW